MKQYDKIRKVSIGYGDDYTTGCLLDYTYFKDNYRLIPIDLSKQKSLDDDPRAIQQTVFQGVVEGAADTKIRLYTILEKSKETILELAKGTTKVLELIQMVEYSKVNVNLSDTQLKKIKNCCQR